MCDIPNSSIIPISAKAAYRYERVKSDKGRTYHTTLTIDDAQVTHIAPKLIINTMTHLYQATMVFGSSLFPRVTSHDGGLFSLELPSTASGSRSISRVVVAVLDECREAVMTEESLWEDGGAMREPIARLCRSEGTKINESDGTLPHAQIHPPQLGKGRSWSQMGKVVDRLCHRSPIHHPKPACLSRCRTLQDCAENDTGPSVC